jgi:hypothetical protein
MAIDSADARITILPQAQIHSHVRKINVIYHIFISQLSYNAEVVVSTNYWIFIFIFIYIF